MKSGLMRVYRVTRGISREYFDFEAEEDYLWLCLFMLRYVHVLCRWGGERQLAKAALGKELQGGSGSGTAGWLRNTAHCIGLQGSQESE